MIRAIGGGPGPHKRTAFSHRSPERTVPGVAIDRRGLHSGSSFRHPTPHPQLICYIISISRVKGVGKVIRVKLHGSNREHARDSGDSNLRMGAYVRSPVPRDGWLRASPAPPPPPAPRGLSDRRKDCIINLTPGMKNVLRFPIERRLPPTLDLLRENAPDVREVLNIAEAFGMEAPAHTLREQVDAATAEHIANQMPTSGPGRAAMLTELLDAVVAAAVAACRASHDAWVEAAEAQQALLRAQSDESFWIEPLRDQAEALTRRAAELLLIAQMRVEEAEGVARAVGIACRGEKWMPRDRSAEADALFGFAAAG